MTQIARIQPIELVPYYALPNTNPLSLAFDPAPNLNVALGTVMGQVTAAVNDVDTLTITGTPSGGTFTITIENNTGLYTTTALAYNASTATVQTAVQALANIGAGNVLVTGTAGTSYVLTGAGALAGYAIGTVTATGSFTGGTSPAIANVHTTPNILVGQIKPYASGSSDGSQIPVGLSKWAFTTDINGNITLGSGNTFGIAQGHLQTVPLWITGPFRESELVGLDSNAITKFGGRELILADATKLLPIPGP